MRILFTVCGRAGSKGIKNKNVRDFLGKPLVYYTLSVISLYQKKHLEDDIDIALNTDSLLLRDIVMSYDKLNIDWIQRKEELAGDLVAKKEVIIDTYLMENRKYNKEYDIVVDLDITSPLRTLSDLEGAVDKQKKTEADVVFSVTESRRNPYFNMVVETDKGYRKAINSVYNTRQEAPVMYDMNASIYVYKTKHLSEGKGVLEGYNEIIKMQDTGILDLDREDDLLLMEIIAGYFVKNNSAYKEIYENI